ncbi:MAG: FHA domain-containing protein, partial [Patescibacteria group bacterium]
DAPDDQIPIMPEIDFYDVMPTDTQRCVSRLQAALEWLEHEPKLRTLSVKSGTWIRRSGSKKKKAIQLHEYHTLKHGDMIQLGHPKGVYVRLRIHFHGSPK